MAGDERPAPGRADRFPVLFAAGVLAVAALLAFGNGLQGPFLFDDNYVLTDNPTIRHLWPPWTPLFPPADSTTGGRPLLSFSFALNYAVSAEESWSYHLLNVLIHLAAALTLMGIVRRTFLLPSLREKFGRDADALAAATALLWMVHPVQTSAVTYISQRAESMMGLFYLLTLYGLIRAAKSPAKRRWPVLCVGACVLGMATKEVMVTAPLVALLYDRTFLTGTFREAWRLRRRIYLGLAGTWLLLAWLMHDLGKRNVGPGFGVSPWAYFWTECHAIIHYLALAAWPHPLAIDYGSTVVSGPTAVWPEALLLVLVLAATAVAFLRWPRVAFASVWFFIILAPTSSIVPVPLSPIGDHRLYLPLAGLVLLLVLGLHALLGRYFLWAVGMLAVVWSTLTFLRNDDFRSPLALWRQTVAACPGNARAHNNYGEYLVLNQERAEGMEQFRQAVQLQPDYTEAYNDWGYALFLSGRRQEAIEHYQAALRIDPRNAAAHYNLANALVQTGRNGAALEHYRTAVTLKPDFVEAWFNLGAVLAQMGRRDEAISAFEAVLQNDPTNAQGRAYLEQLEKGR